MSIQVDLTLLAWLVVEATLLLRDRVRGKGSTARDQGTRRLFVVGWLAAFVLATAAADAIGSHPGWALGRGHLPAGLALMWLGLVVRVWAVLTLGASFRTTVEVDAGQPLVDNGPYRWVRHPSYTGILVIAIGYGLVLGNWLSLAVLIVIPLATMLRRIGVEEAAMIEVIGPPYLDYQRRTKRLVPGLW